MAQDVYGSQLVELTHEIFVGQGVCFDPDNIRLQGLYHDELSAHRAKRLWSETLEANFLLDHDQDFCVSVTRGDSSTQFVLTCEFLTACARYAFWRLTNNQAPEAQYVIETAHIPVCDSRHEDILRAPDMRSIYDEPSLLNAEFSAELRDHRTPKVADWLKGLLRRIR